MRRRHRAVAREMIGLGLLDATLDRLRDLARECIRRRLHAIGAVMTRATFDRGDLRAGHEREHVARLRSDVLHALMTGRMPCDFTERVREIRLEQAGLMALPEIFEWIEDVALDE